MSFADVQRCLVCMVLGSAITSIWIMLQQKPPSSSCSSSVGLLASKESTPTSMKCFFPSKDARTPPNRGWTRIDAYFGLPDAVTMFGLRNRTMAGSRGGTAEGVVVVANNESRHNNSKEATSKEQPEPPSLGPWLVQEYLNNQTQGVFVDVGFGRMVLDSDILGSGDSSGERSFTWALEEPPYHWKGYCIATNPQNWDRSAMRPNCQLLGLRTLSSLDKILQDFQAPSTIDYLSYAFPNDSYFSSVLFSHYTFRIMLFLHDTALSKTLRTWLKQYGYHPLVPLPPFVLETMNSVNNETTLTNTTTTATIWIHSSVRVL